MTRRLLVAGDLAAFFAFFLVGVASHEREIGPAVFARSFLPFALSWLTLGAALGAFREAGPSARLLAVYLTCGMTALIGRAVVFDRALFNAFFVIVLVGNGVMLFAWRLAAVRLSSEGGRPAPGTR